MSRIRVLEFVWRLSIAGGKSSVDRQLLRAIDRSRFDMHVCTLRPLFAADRIEELGPGITYHPLDLVGSPTIAMRARALLGVARVARAVRPDILHTHSGFGLYAIPAGLGPARRSRKILQIHDSPQSGRSSPSNNRIMGIMVRRLGYVPLVHSRSVRDELVSAWHLLAGGIQSIPLGIDVARIARLRCDDSETRARFSLPTDRMIVLYTARLVKSKNPELFLRVAERVLASRSDVAFVLAGEGPLRVRMEQRVRDRGLDAFVRVVGFVDDLAPLYRLADVFLSTSSYEGFGLAIAEAMAAATPVVSTAVGGVGDVIVEGVTGTLVPDGDVDGLIRALARYLDDAALRERTASAARARAVGALDSTVMVHAFEQFYERVAAGDL